MIRFLMFVLWLLLPVSAAQAALGDSRSWFEALPPEERSATQSDLILVGLLQRPADGDFGEGTFEALIAFQTGQGLPVDGVLDHEQRQLLGELAAEAHAAFGMQWINDHAAHASLSIPARLLTERQRSEAGTAYVSVDRQLSLVTMFTPLGEVSFAELFALMVVPDDERSVSFQEFTATRFLIGGMIGGYSFYTLFLDVGEEAIGYSLAWGEEYAEEGPIAAAWIGSTLAPLAQRTPDEEERRKAAAEQPERGPAAFNLPAGDGRIIALNAEITLDTAAEFAQALEARPDARIVVLNSPGGMVDTALEMAREIRKRGLQTYVPAGLGCYSACAYMFLAGENRQAEGELGVHQISTDVLDLISAQATLGDVLDALEEYGVQQPVISRMLRTPPDDMYVFSADELSRFGINRGEPIAVALTAEELVGTPVVAADGPVHLVLSRLGDAAAAERSRGYMERRWGSILVGVEPEIVVVDGVHVVRVAMPSTERANATCAAIKADGGGCYIAPR